MSRNSDSSTDPLITRRKAVAGLALGGAGLMSAGLTRKSAEAAPEWTLDLDSAEDNCIAILKMQADTSGADAMGGFPGEVWAWIPNEGTRMILRTYGVGVSHVEYRPEERGWRFYHREVLLLS
jgi:hypothetical protein